MVNSVSVVVLLVVVTGVKAVVMVVEYDVWSENWRHGHMIYFESDEEKCRHGIHSV